MNYTHVLSLIRDAFIHQGTFSGSKKIIEFHDADGKFQWDIYNFYIREQIANGEPRYYCINAPYDMTWKDSPQQALVFESGRLIFSTDFTESVRVRTGAMDAIFLQSLGITSLCDKKILMVWSGGTAKYSYLFLQDTYADIWSIAYTNRSWAHAEFEALGDLHYIKNPDLGKYDIILLHAHVSEPYLWSWDLDAIKPGTIITSYGGMTPERDIHSDFFTSERSIVVDMTANIDNLKPLKTAIERSQIQADEVIDLGSQLSKQGISYDPSKITICISWGTYIQNIAMMKYMMEWK
jgi:ornithine cyclodeaminase/alanine dehydrogenase-like protein (mu-crystallin family)